MTPERRAVCDAVLAAVTAWARIRPDVRAVALVGSWARGAARMDSDIDVVVLTTDVAQYERTSGWVAAAVDKDAPVVSTRWWGVLLERRVLLPGGLEVEFGFAPPSWAWAEPLDDGTARVVGDGFVALHDPDGLLGRLVQAVAAAQRSQGQETGATYDRIAQAYAARSEAAPRQLRGHVEHFASLMPPHAVVLDAGSGPGQFAAVLAELGCRPIALDVSAGMLHLAAQHVPAVRADLRRLPVRDGCLDGIWSSASLLHVPRADVPATLRGWRSALRPGGVLALSTAVKDADGEGWEEVPYATERRRWFVYHSPDRVLGMVASAGFEVGETETQEGARRWLHVVATAGH